jgi:hypothetical protein
MILCWRREFLAGLAAGLAGAVLGCGDMGSLAYFLTPEQSLPAKLKHLPSDDPKQREPRALILTYAQLDTRAELIHADRQLSQLLAVHLQQLVETAKQKLNIVPTRKVEEFKNAHPDWRGMDNAEIGRKFGADYVIYLEINSLGLYEHGSHNTMYRGRANIRVSLIDVNRPDNNPLPETYVCTFPSEARGPIMADEVQPLRFRQEFLAHVARQLSWYFCDYPRSEPRIIERAW